MSGINPSELVSRNTAEIIFDWKTTDDVAICFGWFTGGAVGAPGFGCIQYKAECAYYIGAMQEWARLTGSEIPPEMTPFLMDVQAAYREGQADRYADREAAGAAAAGVAYELKQI